eukprot:4266394-Pleurochrysis_carterae.AAC.1
MVKMPCVQLTIGDLSSASTLSSRRTWRQSARPTKKRQSTLCVHSADMRAVVPLEPGVQGPLM